MTSTFDSDSLKQGDVAKIEGQQRTGGNDNDVGGTLAAVHGVGALGDAFQGGARQVGQVLPRQSQDAGAPPVLRVLALFDRPSILVSIQPPPQMTCRFS